MRSIVVTEDEVVKLAKGKYGSMKSRCGKEKAYLDVKICDEWLENSQMFIDFTLDWWRQGYFPEGFEIDKDILGNGKLYSPSTCCYVPSRLNLFFVNCQTDPYKDMRRIQYDEWQDKYYAQAAWCGRSIVVSYCDCEVDALIDYILFKRKVGGKILADNRGKIHPKVVEAVEKFGEMELSYWYDRRINQYY